MSLVFTQPSEELWIAERRKVFRPGVGNAGREPCRNGKQDQAQQPQQTSRRRQTGQKNLRRLRKKITKSYLLSFASEIKDYKTDAELNFLLCVSLLFPYVGYVTKVVSSLRFDRE